MQLIFHLANQLNIALVGNPNSGKTSLFNSLTGLNQKVGNFPGVTVDKKTGTCSINNKLTATLIDLPGAYSLYPKRADEWVAYRVLLNQDVDVKPDVILLVVDASNLKRNLLFCSQIIDLKKPVVVALTMLDIAKKKGIQINVGNMERELGVPIVEVNPRKNIGISNLKNVVGEVIAHQQNKLRADFINLDVLAENAIKEVKQIVPKLGNYSAVHYLINHEHFSLDDSIQEKIEQVEIDNKFNHTKSQAEEIMMRYERIKHIMQQSVVEENPLRKTLFTEKLDNFFLHRTWGYLILLMVLFLLFQSVFWIAHYPMDGIEWCFSQLSSWLSGVMPQGWFADLFINGIVAGLSGIMVFIPQIMILFGIITLLEDTGYMARIGFLTDKLIRKVGLNGKSVMPMISGFACAVPAIMSARNIENQKERLLTIMITPLMSCSARLPVYTILVSLIIPSKLYFGFLSLQGLVMMGLYLIGFLMALVVSYVMKWFIHIKEKSFFILELPMYRGPRWKNVVVTMVEKAKIFLFDAGKIIMLISLLLWALSHYGPKNKMAAVTQQYQQKIQAANSSNQIILNREYKNALLQNSYIGTIGKAIEPVIRPLGYDWKIGIALVTSFAAREVFVGTMATLYSVGDNAKEKSETLSKKMSEAVRPDGTKIYTTATGFSLLIFYVFAMQCMSTLAVVKRETRSWKWPAIQLAYMTGLAYFLSWMIYVILK